MVVKVVSLFLIGMLVLAMFGRLRAPRIRNPLSGRGKGAASGGTKSLGDARKCKACGAYIIGDGPCPCGKS